MMWVAPGREISAGDPTLETIGVINQSHFLWTVNLQTGKSFVSDNDKNQQYLAHFVLSPPNEVWKLASRTLLSEHNRFHSHRVSVFVSNSTLGKTITYLF